MIKIFHEVLSAVGAVQTQFLTSCGFASFYRCFIINRCCAGTTLYLRAALPAIGRVRVPIVFLTLHRGKP